MSPNNAMEIIMKRRIIIFKVKMQERHKFHIEVLKLSQTHSIEILLFSRRQNNITILNRTMITLYQ